MGISLMDLCSSWLLPIALASYLFLRTVYRLYLHPLSGIPGPKLAAATYSYDFFYSVVRPGVFLFEIEKMHQKYGPIVRINPQEIHINDPNFYNEIYAPTSRKRDKESSHAAMFLAPESMLTTLDHSHHRFRRSILTNFFSKASVLQISETFNERIQRALLRLKEFQETKSVVPLHNLFSALTSDLICSYSCGKHWGFLDDPDFRNDIRQSNEEAIEILHINRFIPWIAPIMHIFSTQTMAMLLPGKSAFFEFLGSFLNYAVEVSHGEVDKTSTSEKGNMIKALVDSNLPANERSHNRVRDEMTTLISAGTDTTTSALVLSAYHLGRDETLRDKLRAELKQVMPTADSRPTWPELEKLPYMSGFVNEALRLSYGTIGRLVRIAPTEALTYKDCVIPPGTPMSTSTYFVHRDPSIFPDPEAFEPERWIQAAEKGQNLGRYLTSFSKGSRSCIAMNFAQMEIFMTLAHFARWFDVQLHDTDPEDVRIVKEMFVPRTRRGGLQVYAKVSFHKD